MDNFPKTTVAVREISRTSSTATVNSRPNPSPSPSTSKTSSESTRHSCEAPHSPNTSRERGSESLFSFPPPDDYNSTTAYKNNSTPPYRAAAAQGKSEEDIRRLRKRDYAMEISRLMGRQMVKGLNRNR